MISGGGQLYSGGKEVEWGMRWRTGVCGTLAVLL